MSNRKKGRHPKAKSFAHPKIACLNNSSAGIALSYGTKDQRTAKYVHDPHIDPHLVWAGKAEHISFKVNILSRHVYEHIPPKAILQSAHRKRAFLIQLYFPFQLGEQRCIRGSRKIHAAPFKSNEAKSSFGPHSRQYAVTSFTEAKVALKIPHGAKLNALYPSFLETPITTNHTAEGIAIDYVSYGRIISIEIFDVSNCSGDLGVLRRAVPKNVVVPNNRHWFTVLTACLTWFCLLTCWHEQTCIAATVIIFNSISWRRDLCSLKDCQGS